MKGLVLHVYRKDREVIPEQLLLDELDALISTIGFVGYKTLKISVREISPGTYFGISAVQVVQKEIENVKNEGKVVECVYVSEELTGSQHAHLEKVWGVLVLDRVNLILRIFEQHAKTREAKLQVEIAELEYLLPRLKGMWTHFSRIEGGIGFSKGPGEKQIEIDRRLIKSRIAFLRKKLKKIGTSFYTQSKKRRESEIKQIALAGYTNVGKTSFLEALSKEALGSENKVFATLSPTVRKIYLKDNCFVLLSDTVGFISNLPHFLLASFRTTFQNVFQSQSLILIQDASSPYIEEQLRVVNQLLEELGVKDMPKYLVFNKVDLLSDSQKFLLQNQYPEAFFISIKTSEGILRIKEQIAKDVQE